MPQRTAELSRHNCLSYTLTSLQDDNHWVFGARGGIRIPVRGNLIANNGDALLAAALGGQGIIYQPDFIVGDAIRDGKLMELKMDEPTTDLGGIHVLYPPERRPPAKVRVMIDYLAEVIGA